MNTDPSEAALPLEAPELWHLPGALDARVRRCCFDPSRRMTTEGVDREVGDAVEVEIRVSEPFGIRALGPVLWVGDEPLAIGRGATTICTASPRSSQKRCRLTRRSHSGGTVPVLHGERRISVTMPRPSEIVGAIESVIAPHPGRKAARLADASDCQACANQLTSAIPGEIMFIGRDAEAAKIGRFLRELSAGPRVLLIEGEAGIGKTTLLRQGQDAAVQRGITVLTAYPVESEVPLEFAGLADLLNTVPAGVFGALPVPQQQAVRQAVLRTEPLERSADPRTTATAVLTLLRSLAEEHPVVVLIDDLPCLDSPSARALSFALRRLRHEPVGLLAAVRTDWSAGSPWLATNTIPAERVDSLRLKPLSLGAIRELLATRTTLSPSRSLLLRLYETSGGNPLFALQLAERATSGIPPGPRDTLDVPGSLLRLVSRRVTMLPRRTRDVLLVCSLATEPVLPVISAAARQPATAFADLQAGIQAGLLVNVRGSIAFVHPLMRSVVIEQAQAADRRAAHRRLAAIVRGPEARARHLAMGTEGPDEAVAGELEAAAQMAAHRGACDTAGDLAELAVTFTPFARPENQRRRIILAASSASRHPIPLVPVPCLKASSMPRRRALPVLSCGGVWPGIACSAESRWHRGPPR